MILQLSKNALGGAAAQDIQALWYPFRGLLEENKTFDYL